jgi:O-antigen/teichoic acid export membrane protein
MPENESPPPLSQARHHFKNASALVLSGAFAKVLMFLATVVVIKALSVADNGDFQLAFRYGFILALFTELGVRGYLVRELARSRADEGAARRLFGNVLNLRLLLTPLVLPLAVAVLWAAGYPRHTIVLVIGFFFFAVLDSFAILFKFVLRAYERMEFDALFSILGRAAILCGVCWFAASRVLNPGTVTASHLGAAAIECVLLAILIRAMLPMRFLNPVDPQGIRVTLARSMPFAVLNVVGLLYLSTGTIVLSRLAGSEAVGYFNTAARLPEALQFLPIAVVNALIPFLARHHEDLPLVRRYFSFLIRYLGFFGITFATLFMFETDFVIRAIAKPEYLIAAPAFRWYGLWILLVFIQIATANLLICLNAEKTVMRRFIFSLALNVLLNIAFVHRLGVIGAAAALALTELTSCCLDCVILWRRGVRLPVSAFLEIAAVGAACAAPVLFLQGIPPLLRLAVSAGTTSLAIALIAWVQDREIIRRILKKSPSTPPETHLSPPGE